MTSIAYCTNVHPSRDLDQVLDQLDTVRSLLELDMLDLGLWLPAELAHALAADPSARRRLRAELAARDLAVSSLNAFPYGDFHAEVVKRQVYLPSWSDPRRLAYTADCATVLADLLPDSARYGSISTLPLGWGPWWSDEDDARAASALLDVTEALRLASARHGKPIRLAVEPEPGCVLDTVADAVAWLADRVDPRYIGICLDTCHLAVSFADPAETVAAILRAGLSVVKLQASAALEIAEPDTDHSRRLLSQFTEPRYLHQVRENSPLGVLAADDLPEALRELPGENPWRVHFHVPLHACPTAPVTATTDVLRQAFSALASAVDELPHIEVETYTWHVLADQHDIAAGIAAELRWARNNLRREAPTCDQ
ncbi:metabolite traffic protein EboE [Nocardia sp. NPDC004722]